MPQKEGKKTQIINNTDKKIDESNPRYNKKLRMNYNETTLHQQIWWYIWNEQIPWGSKLPMLTQKETNNLIIINLLKKVNPLF